MEFKSDFLNILKERELLNQCSSLEKLDETLSSRKIKAYIGFDCTANSLHVGSLISILLLKYFQKSGHIPIVLLGSGTTMVGDPSGKDESRKLLTLEQIHHNKLGIQKVLENFITINDKTNPILDNATWLKEFNYLEFLREFGTHFTINRMLSFDSVKLRLERESPLTFLEFNYMLLQAVDYLYLYKNYNVELQMGGSDQWGNIINGTELIRKTTQKEVFALTSHLITKSDGTKMGKTANGAIWLTKEMLSSWDFYQYFRNVDDLDVIKYLKNFTEVPLTEIAILSKLKGKDLNEAKKILAFEITKLCHGEKEALDNQNIAINTFENNILDENLPTFFLDEKNLENGIAITSLLVNTGMTTSNSEARKLILNSGVKINNATCNDINAKITKQNLNNGIIKLSVGKKKHILIKIQE